MAGVFRLTTRQRQASWVIMGMYEKNGFTLEKILLNFIRYKLCPQIRTYKTENIYRSIAEEIEYIEEVEMLETGRKKVKSKK